MDSFRILSEIAPGILLVISPEITSEISSGFSPGIPSETFSWIPSGIPPEIPTLIFLSILLDFFRGFLQDIQKSSFWYFSRDYPQIFLDFTRGLCQDYFRALSRAPFIDSCRNSFKKCFPHSFLKSSRDAFRGFQWFYPGLSFCIPSLISNEIS